MRMGIRRFTRLTNAFSKKMENHFYALAIYFMHYNYVRIHTTLRVTSAMPAGVSKTLGLWTTLSRWWRLGRTAKRAMGVQTRMARATYYRLKAEETRTIAEAMEHSAARAAMLEIAATYERMAAQEEKRAGEPSN